MRFGDAPLWRGGIGSPGCITISRPDRTNARPVWVIASLVSVGAAAAQFLLYLNPISLALPYPHRPLRFSVSIAYQKESEKADFSKIN